MIFTLGELIDVVMMTAIIGYIFKDAFERRGTSFSYDPLRPQPKNESFWFAAISIGSSILLHELGHKFAALFLGLQATFHAAYKYLFLGILLKLANFNYIFFVPAYVSHTATDPTNSAIIAFAGPGVNLVLWLICGFLIKNNHIPRKYLQVAYFTKYINGFLFVVNMLPIPGLDGYWVLNGMIKSVI